MGRVIDEMYAAHPEVAALQGYDRARWIRRYAYARIVLASTSDSHLSRDVLNGPLADVFAAFDRSEGGVWCAGAAGLLARLYLEAGCRAWKYTYGAGSPVTHAVTLVEADGQVYLQDAYFNTDYVADDGQPLPFFDVLARLRARRTPRLRQDTDLRKGLFVSEANAREWVSPERTDETKCEVLSPGRVLCRFTMLFETYARSHIKAGEVTSWLAAQGYADDWSYLMLRPRPGQKFLSPRRGTGDALESDREMALSIARAVNGSSAGE